MEFGEFQFNLSNFIYMRYILLFLPYMVLEFTLIGTIYMHWFLNNHSHPMLVVSYEEIKRDTVGNFP